MEFRIKQTLRQIRHERYRMQLGETPSPRSEKVSSNLIGF
jgi:hypothetical protein